MYAHVCSCGCTQDVRVCHQMVSSSGEDNLTDLVRLASKPRCPPASASLEVTGTHAALSDFGETAGVLNSDLHAHMKEISIGVCNTG